MSQVQSKPEQQRLQMLGWLIDTSHGEPHFDCGIGDADKGEGKYFRRDGLRKLNVEAINHRSKFFRAVNTAGVEMARRPLNVYITAAVSDLQSWLMMDDLSLDKCREIAGDRTHMIVQTSPGRHHLWLATTRPVSIVERKICQQALQKRLGGDVSSTSGDHFGRLAGFWNAKRRCWVNYVEATLTDRRTDVEKLLKIAAEMGFVSDLSPKGGVYLPPQAVVDLPLSQGVLEQVEPQLVFRPVSSNKSEYFENGRDESRAEFAFACVYVQKNLDIEAGIQKLAQRALDRRKRTTWKSAEAYARKTFDAVLRRGK